MNTVAKVLKEWLLWPTVCGLGIAIFLAMLLGIVLAMIKWPILLAISAIWLVGMAFYRNVILDEGEVW